MRIFLLVATSFLLVGCESGEKTASQNQDTCRGIYYERDQFGNLKKYNEYERAGQCWTDNLKLTRFEETQEKWEKNNVTCQPVSGFSSRSLVAANNYYDYRDGRAYLQLDSSTGIFRRVVLAEGRDGQPTYAKLQGCFFVRGDQILLDTDVSKIITSQYFDPWEIFSFTESGNEINMVRFDDTADYDFRFCPILNTPWKFCELLRNGNEMFYPTLTPAQMADLTNEAIIISKQFNWTTVPQSTFDSLWETVDQNRTEAVREDYKYDVIHIVDTPRYIDQAWKAYVKGERPTMPDTSSSTIPPICYPSSRDITLADGSTGKIFGEVCYVNGQYEWTPN